MSPYRLVFGKVYRLPVELDHRAYWAVKKLNVGSFMAGQNKLLELNELDEFRNEAYENAKIYKEKSKSRWLGLFAVVVSLPYGAVQIHSEKIGHFKVNGQKLKHYLEGPVEKRQSVMILEPF
ncbi:uncharacterized protein LOC133779325 [Humulus lupulus]|uniref:uncharacterized protein LOC133779325 n=1 Tax=Humulus lupulus TaxID=3486 RepID=UPI002B410C78|nr:uncharacterized protein LOC133779325 [Humulus lupulus]